MQEDLITLKQAVTRFGITNNQCRYVISARPDRPEPVGKIQNGRQNEFLYRAEDIENVLKIAYPRMFRSNLYVMQDLSAASGLAVSTVHRKVKALWRDKVITIDRGWFFNEDDFRVISKELIEYSKVQDAGRCKKGRFVKKERNPVEYVRRNNSILDRGDAQDNYMIQSFLKGDKRACTLR